ncbi:MAG: L-lactate dehydrogenase [Clostridiales bacterium]|nr:L-lactate dehydrogenase [Clostridiales bacterium]
MNNIIKGKVAIIGAGAVGSTAAYAILTRGVASEIILFDINKDLAEGEAMDLAQGASFVKPTKIYAGSYEDCAGAEIVVITAGAAQKEGETRLDLVEKNINVMKDIVSNLIKHCPESIYLLVTNPVDILTYVVYKLSGLPAGKVIGSGTVLDSSRFRHLLSQHCNVDARNVHAYVLGEHGDSEVLAWSTANVAGIPVDKFCKECVREQLENDWHQEITTKVVRAAYEIIERKGATYFAIGLGITRIIEAILRSERSVLTVSTLVNGHFGINDICLSLPCIVDGSGVAEVLNVPISDREIDKLKKSASTLKEILKPFEGSLTL